MTHSKFISIEKTIKSILTKDKKCYSVGKCSESICEGFEQGIHGYRVKVKCCTDNELTMANSDCEYKFIAAESISEVTYRERIG